MYQKIFLTALCSLSVFSTFGQTKSENLKKEIQTFPGYIVTSNQNDTTYGKILFVNPVLSQNQVTFYKNGEKTIYKPAEGYISEYGFETKRYNKTTQSTESYWFTYIYKLVPKPMHGNGSLEVFVERQTYGDFNLFNFFTLETGKINSHEYTHNYFVEKQGIEGFGIVTITRENYRETVREYIVLDNDEIEANLGTDGFGYKYLGNLITIQNAWISNNPIYPSLVEAAKNTPSSN